MKTLKFKLSLNLEEQYFNFNILDLTKLFRETNVFRGNLQLCQLTMGVMVSHAALQHWVCLTFATPVSILFHVTDIRRAHISRHTS